MIPTVLIGCGSVLQTERDGIGIRIENLSIGDYVLDLFTERVVAILDMTVRTLTLRQITRDPKFAIRLGKNTDGSAFLIGVPIKEEPLMAGHCSHLGRRELAEWDRHGTVFYQVFCARPVLCNLGTGSTVRLARTDHNSKGNFAASQRHLHGWPDYHTITTQDSGAYLPGARA